MTSRRSTRKRTDQGRARKDPRASRLAVLSPPRRARLLDRAEAEFAAYGFHAASLNRILAAARMSKGQAYYYVADKADLYRAVIERAFERLMDHVGGEFPNPRTAAEFWSAVRNLLTRLTAALKNNERLALLARGIYEGSQTQAALAEPLSRVRTRLAELATMGQTVKAIRTDVPLALLVSAVFGAAREMDVWFAHHWQDLSVEEALRMNDKAIDLIEAMAAATERPQERKMK